MMVWEERSVNEKGGLNTITKSSAIINHQQAMYEKIKDIDRIKSCKKNPSIKPHKETIEQKKSKVKMAKLHTSDRHLGRLPVDTFQ